MEIGVYTFGDLVAAPHTGRTVSGEARVRQMLDLARRADAAGLDVVARSLALFADEVAPVLRAHAAPTGRQPAEA